MLKILPDNISFHKRGILMRLSVKILVLAAVTLISGLTLVSPKASHAASGEEIIKARINFMKDKLEAHWKPIGAFGKSGTGSLAEVEKHALALAKLAQEIPSHFPPNTGRGDYADKLTRSLPEIWLDWEGFKKDVQVLADGSEKLARLAREGNKEAVVDMIGKTGSYGRTKIGCVECHKNFRGDRVK